MGEYAEMYIDNNIDSWEGGFGFASEFERYPPAKRTPIEGYHYWRTVDGARVEFKDMGYEHLENALVFLRREHGTVPDLMQKEFDSRTPPNYADLFDDLD